jgi:hypothetical protein
MAQLFQSGVGARTNLQHSNVQLLPVALLVCDELIQASMFITERFVDFA